MKEEFKGALLDLDRRSRESVPSRRARMSRDWVSLAGRMGGSDEAPLDDEEEDRRPWLRPLPLWLAALRSGGTRLLLAASRQRRRMFHEAPRLAGFLAVGYQTPPAGLLEELAWLREAGVRRVIVPLDQDASGPELVKALGAIENLRAENCHVGAVLRPGRDAATEPEAWQRFCQSMLAQSGWQLEHAQVGDTLEGMVRGRGRGTAGRAPLVAHLPRLRQEFPGVALLTPAVARLDAARVAHALLQLAPVDSRWDGVNLRAPPWQTLPSVGRDGAFLLQLALAGAVATLVRAGAGRVQVQFPPLPDGCDEAAAERVAGSIVRRTVLALCAGVSEHIVVGIDPQSPPSGRGTLTAALRELQAQLDGARFLRRLRVGDPNRDFVLEFAHGAHASLLVAWTDDESRLVEVPFEVGVAGDFLRRGVPLLPYPRIRLTRNLVYYRRTSELTGVLAGRANADRTGA
jgi:hypothetical protein